MTQLEQSQKDQLKSLKDEFKRLQKQLQAVHDKTGYEDLEHGVLALQIAEHAVEETLEHTALAVRFATSRIPKHTVRRSSGTRS
jgi:predicted  nucleic acid-binding Zn-ribbon protein